ncbi:MAG: carbohydrate porin [Alphaproteobacteria bacterium]|nr:carbohydrate porin [Alphaproteobacteria bacterium]MBL6937880.1 carbohydrate porin [Alphaproteobacteria bacterium]MBL7099295.1 carbohydrate porin [Alphaproteobacteria bacterium]
MSLARTLCAAVLIAAVLPLGPARADNAVLRPIEDLGDFLHRDALIAGNTFGLRKELEDRGIVVGIDEIAEVQGNVTGGLQRASAADGRLELFANVDMSQLVGWKATVHINAYQIHGRGLTAGLGNLLTVSNIDATPSFRLFTLWVEQSLFDDQVSIRAGQIAADDEFAVSQYASVFINSAFGWPSLMGTDLPSGGPAYPLATPGMRVRVAVSPSVVLMGAILNGDPAPAGPGDPQLRNPDGLRFRTDGGLLLIGEMDYSYNIGDNLPGTLKLGAWYHDGDFANQRTDTAGNSLASPLSNGVAGTLHSDFGGHIIVDQMLWRETLGGDQGLDAFVRMGAGPGDRNMVQFHADGGLTYTGLIDGRDTDVVGLAYSYERIGDARRGLSQDLRAVAGPGVPLADYESVIEFSYQAQVAPWLIVQPDLQLVLHPGARLLDVGAPVTPPPHDALVLGLRTAVSF